MSKLLWRGVVDRDKFWRKIIMEKRVVGVLE